MTTRDRLVVAVEVDGDSIDAATSSFHRRGGSLSTTVQYLPEYLADGRPYVLDPALPQQRHSNGL